MMNIDHLTNQTTAKTCLNKRSSKLSLKSNEQKPEFKIITGNIQNRNIKMATIEKRNNLYYTLLVTEQSEADHTERLEFE
jgi:hypothetical protein